MPPMMRSRMLRLTSRRRSSDVQKKRKRSKDTYLICIESKFGLLGEAKENESKY
jgi:hypothetical protein